MRGRPLRVWRRWRVVAALVLFDGLLGALVWGIATVVSEVALGNEGLTRTVLADVATNVAVWVGLRALVGLYPGYGLGSVEELRRQSYAVLAALATVVVFDLAFHVGNLISGLLLVLGFLGLAVLAPVLRHGVKLGLRRFGLWGKLVVVLGPEGDVMPVVSSLRRDWELGLKPVAVFDDKFTPSRTSTDERPSYDDASYEPSLANTELLAEKRDVDTVILAMAHVRQGVVAGIVDRFSTSFQNVIVVAGTGGIGGAAASARNLGGTLGVEVRHNLLDKRARRTKRALDLFGVLVGGLLISPLLLSIAILVKLDSPGPVFYRHRRLGAGGKHFGCMKFRTMRTDAERLLEEHFQGDPGSRAEWERDQKLRRDPRVTRFGRFLRKVSLDELPQLWNVLRGEMSLIGPRPIVDAEIPKYRDMYKLYQRVTPGISGMWQVSGRSDTTYEERVSMDAYYVRNWSVWLDLWLLARTFTSVVFGRGAY